MQTQFVVAVDRTAAPLHAHCPPRRPLAAALVAGGLTVVRFVASGAMRLSALAPPRRRAGFPDRPQGNLPMPEQTPRLMAGDGGRPVSAMPVHLMAAGAPGYMLLK